MVGAIAARASATVADGLVKAVQRGRSCAEMPRACKRARCRRAWV